MPGASAGRSSHRGRTRSMANDGCRSLRNALMSAQVFMAWQHSASAQRISPARQPSTARRPARRMRSLVRRLPRRWSVIDGVGRVRHRLSRPRSQRLVLAICGASAFSGGEASTAAREPRTFCFRALLIASLISNAVLVRRVFRREERKAWPDRKSRRSACSQAGCRHRGVAHWRPRAALRAVTPSTGFLETSGLVASSDGSAPTARAFPKECPGPSKKRSVSAVPRAPAADLRPGSPTTTTRVARETYRRRSRSP